ncbi:MAG: CopG family transcriptional regulator [Verrucomicrobiota bacterium]
MNKQKTNSKNLEARFDAGEEVLDYFDTAKAVRRNHEKARINLDLPQWMIFSIDRVAGRNGLARQSQIKAWLADKLKEAVH